MLSTLGYTDPVTQVKDRMPGRATIETALIIRRQKAPSNSSPQGEETGMEVEENQDAVSRF